MACGCNTLTTTGTYNAYSGRPSCPLPVRTSTLPTVPQIWSVLPRARQKQEGKLLVADGDELGVLDSPVDGVVLFDGTTGKAYVGDFEVSQVPDNYACTSTATYGFPLYGVRPECGGSAEFPSRDVAILRPQPSSTGTLWAHQRSCGGIGGPAQELTPVEIVPEAWNTSIPAGIMNLSFVRTEPTDCGSTQYRFYINPGQLVVPDGNLLIADFPNHELTVADDADIRLAAYTRLDTGRFILKSIRNTSLQAYVDSRISTVLTDDGYAPSYLNPRLRLVWQKNNELFSYLYGPFNMADYPGYNANAKEIQLFVAAFAKLPAAGTLRYAFYITVNDVIKFTGFAGEEPTGYRGTGEIHVPMPADKLIRIGVQKDIYAGGFPAAPDSAELEVYLEAFK